MKDSREYIPDIKVLEKVLNHSVLKIWRDVERELAESIPLKVSIYHGSVKGPGMLLGQNQIDPPRAEMRIRFRRTFTEGISRYFVEVIVHPTEKTNETGFSGFSAEGKIIEKGNSITIEPRVHAMRYNVWDWTGWM